MTALPAVDVFRNAANQGVGQQWGEDVRQFIAEMPGGAAETTLTIAGGSVTAALGEHAIDTEAAAALDDLDNILLDNRPDGALLLIRAANAAHVVRLRHNVGADGKLILKGGINCRLEGTGGFLLLKRTGTQWEEVFRSLGGWREVLAGNRTYYVRTDGNDTNEGRENSAAGAFATLTKAWTVIRDTLDLAGFVVTVQIGDGTYTTGLVATGQIVGAAGASSVVFQGNNATPGNVVINPTSASAVSASQGAVFTLKDCELRTTTSGQCIHGIGSGTRIEISNLRFGACAGNHMLGQAGTQINAVGNYAIVGGADRHWYVSEAGGLINASGRTITLTGTPAFSQQFALADNNASIVAVSVTFSGTATGTRYIAQRNGTINTGGGGANYLPGSLAGSTNTGGQYV
jgi:hypothetical protein